MPLVRLRQLLSVSASSIAATPSPDAGSDEQNLEERAWPMISLAGRFRS